MKDIIYILNYNSIKFYYSVEDNNEYLDLDEYATWYFYKVINASSAYSVISGKKNKSLFYELMYFIRNCNV